MTLRPTDALWKALANPGRCRCGALHAISFGEGRRVWTFCAARRWWNFWRHDGRAYIESAPRYLSAPSRGGKTTGGSY